MTTNSGEVTVVEKSPSGATSSHAPAPACETAMKRVASR